MSLYDIVELEANESLKALILHVEFLSFLPFWDIVWAKLPSLRIEFTTPPATITTRVKGWTAHQNASLRKSHVSIGASRILSAKSPLYAPQAPQVYINRPSAPPSLPSPHSSTPPQPNVGVEVIGLFSLLASALATRSASRTQAFACNLKVHKTLSFFFSLQLELPSATCFHYSILSLLPLKTYFES